MTAGFSKSLLAAAVLCLPGCAQQFYYRAADGVRVDAKPEVLSTFQMDKTICEGEVAKAAIGARGNVFDQIDYSQKIMRGCMAQKGYVVR